MTKPKLIVLTGAGMSAESGISTFRDSGGIWEQHDIMEVASPKGWQVNPGLVLNFYNQRRAQLNEVEPNAGHFKLAELEQDFEVQIITQNVDDLHERAGSTNILHLHGELRKARSTADPTDIWVHKEDIKLGDTCRLGGQVRPHIVWFGEEVPMIQQAMIDCGSAQVLVVIGTSMAVYPAASLVHYVPADIPKFLIDPNKIEMPAINNLEIIEATATKGVAILSEKLKQNFSNIK
ncbi:MAG: NAD-dependent deacetylase [Limisphaerales bacterium]|jgi:NAD-dependent deacetylase